MSADAPVAPLTHWTAEPGLMRESPRSDVAPALLAALGSAIDPAQPLSGRRLLSALGSDAARHPDAMLWLPDFCRCVALAWIERPALSAK